MNYQIINELWNMSSLVNNIAMVLTSKAQYVDFRNITASTCIFLTKFKKHANQTGFRLASYNHTHCITFRQKLQKCMLKLLVHSMKQKSYHLLMWLKMHSYKHYRTLFLSMKNCDKFCFHLNDENFATENFSWNDLFCNLLFFS